MYQKSYTPPGTFHSCSNVVNTCFFLRILPDKRSDETYVRILISITYFNFLK